MQHGQRARPAATGTADTATQATGAAGGQRAQPAGWTGADMVSTKEGAHLGFFRFDLYGFSFLLAWIYLFLYTSMPGEMLIISGGMESLTYLSSATGLVITLAYCAVRTRRFVSISNTTFVRISAPVLCTVGTALCCLSWSEFGSAGEAVVIVGGLMTGYGSALIVLRWVLVFEQATRKVFLANLPLFLAFTAMLCLTVTYLPVEAVVVSVISFPIISGLCLEMAQSHMDAETLLEMDNLGEASDIDQPRHAQPMLPVLVCVGIVGVLNGILDMSQADNAVDGIKLAHGIVNLLLVFVLVWLAARKLGVSWNDSGVTFLFPAVLLIAICVPVISNESRVHSIMAVGDLSYELLLFSLVVLLAGVYARSAVRFFAIARIINAISFYCGQAFGELLPLGLAANATLQATCTLLVSCIEMALLYLVIVQLDDADETHGAQDRRDDGRDPDRRVGDRPRRALGSTDGRALSGDPLSDNANPRDPLAEPAPAGPAVRHPAQAPVADSSHHLGQTPPADLARRRRFRECATEIEEDFGLSRRECDVFELLAKGTSTRRIQEELDISVNTVSFHVRNIYSKLDVHSKQQLVDLVDTYRAMDADAIPR